jgi:hypothetical protein
LLDEWAQYEALVAEATLREDPNVRWCPNPRCGKPISHPIPDDDGDDGGGGSGLAAASALAAGEVGLAPGRRRRRARRFLWRALAVSCAAAIGALGPVAWHWRAVRVAAVS